MAFGKLIRGGPAVDGVFVDSVARDRSWMTVGRSKLCPYDSVVQAHSKAIGMNVDQARRKISIDPGGRCEEMNHYRADDGEVAVQWIRGIDQYILAQLDCAVVVRTAQLNPSRIRQKRHRIHRIVVKLVIMRSHRNGRNQFSVASAGIRFSSAVQVVVLCLQIGRWPLHIPPPFVRTHHKEVDLVLRGCSRDRVFEPTVEPFSLNSKKIDQTFWAEIDLSEFTG